MVNEAIDGYLVINEKLKSTAIVYNYLCINKMGNTAKYSKLKLRHNWFNYL